jgi:hypothetical protein
MDWECIEYGDVDDGCLVYQSMDGGKFNEEVGQASDDASTS